MLTLFVTFLGLNCLVVSVSIVELTANHEMQLVSRDDRNEISAICLEYQCPLSWDKSRERLLQNKKINIYLKKKNEETVRFYIMVSVDATAAAVLSKLEGILH